MNQQHHSLIKKADAVLCGLFSEDGLLGKRILVGLSGGADSVSLVLVLCALSEKYGFSLLACHVNHMIRGLEADRDEEFAKELCRRLSVPFESVKIDVPQMAAEQKKGLEETARNARYEYFSSFIKCGKADFIATAHTACDNSETVLLNLARGCGLSGLCGIPVQRENIIRPLICATRDEVEQYLEFVGEKYVTDSTNLTNDCTRNIIRHNVIPEFCNINPSFHKAISNMGQIAKRENDFLESIASEHFTDDISELSKLHDVILSRIVGKMYRDFCGTALEMRHTDMLCSEIKKTADSKSGETRIFNLPHGVSARISNGRLEMLESRNTQENTVAAYDFYPEFGINEFLCGKMIAVMTKISDNNRKICKELEYNKNIYSLFMEARLFSDIIKGKIHLRSAHEGEKIRFSGMSKAVRKIYSAKKIPVKERAELPRICDSGTDEILFLPYVGLCDSQYEFSENADIHISIYKLNTEERAINE